MENIPQGQSFFIMSRRAYSQTTDNSSMCCAVAHFKMQLLQNIQNVADNALHFTKTARRKVLYYWKMWVLNLPQIRNSMVAN